MATIGGALLLPPCVGPASITAVALSAVAMRANAEHGFASVAASRSKQDFWHPDDDKPPLRSGDDADGSLLNRRVIKKLHFLMRGDTWISEPVPMSPISPSATMTGLIALIRFNRFLRVGHILFEGERREIDPHGVKARIRRLHCLRQ